jgi:hypothetical protein
VPSAFLTEEVALLDSDVVTVDPSMTSKNFVKITMV